MRIQVKVKANSKQQRLEKLADSSFVAYVKPPAREGKANTAVIELLSKYFDIPKSMVIMIKGEKSKNKVLRLLKEVN